MVNSALVDRIVYPSQTVDPSTRLPIVIVDSTALPPPQAVGYEELVKAAIKRLPQTNYALLFFACGAPNKPSWSWVAQTYAMLERPVRKRVRKIYVVHESWWVRTITQMLRGVVSAKFKSKIVHVSSLSQLAQLIDMTVINIRPNVYVHNLKIESTITIPRHPTPVFGMRIDHRDGFDVPSLWTDCLDFLRVTAPVTRGVFCKTDRTDLLAILRECYDRSQVVDLDDYGAIVTACLVKQYLYELPEPVLPASKLPLPMKDSVDYTVAVFQGLPSWAQYLLYSLTEILASVVVHGPRTLHNPTTIAQQLAPGLCGRASREQLAIGVRYTRNLVENWPAVSKAVRVRLPQTYSHCRHSSVSDSLMVSKQRQPNPPPSPLRNLSKKNVSSPELRTDPFADPIAPEQLQTRATSDPSLPFEEPKVMGPPPVPPKASVLKPIENTSRPEVKPKPKVKPLKPEKPEPRRFGPRAKSVTTTRRGKMVAELAKLYEDKSHAAQVLVDLERSRRA